MRINIDDVKDKEYRWLSNDAIHPFEIDGLIFPSVSHYICAIISNDDGLKERISETNSLKEAKKIARKATKPIKPTYRNLYNALNAKFSGVLLQKLLELSDETFTSKDVITARIITDIITRHKQDDEEPVFDEKYFLEEPSPLKRKDKDITEGFLDLLIRIKDEEGMNKIYEEMIYDAIYNISSYYNINKKLVEYIQKHNNSITIRLYTKSDYLESIKKIDEVFKEKLNDKSYKIKSLTITYPFCILLRFIKNNKRIYKDIYNRMIGKSSFELEFLDIDRPYRQKVELKYELLPIDDNDIKINKYHLPERITKGVYNSKLNIRKIILGDKTYFDVFGSEVNENIRAFKSIGGKYIEKRDVVRFETKYYPKLFSYTFELLDDEEKYNIAFGEWVKEKVDGLIDIASLVADIQSTKTIDANNVKLVIEYFLQKDLDKEYVNMPGGYIDMISESIVSRDKVITPEATEIISKFMNIISTDMIKGISDGTYDQYLDKLDENEMRAYNLINSIKPIVSLTPIQTAFIRSVCNVMLCLNIVNDIPITEENVMKFIMIVLTPKLQKIFKLKEIEIDNKIIKDVKTLITPFGNMKNIPDNIINVIVSGAFYIDSYLKENDAYSKDIIRFGSMAYLDPNVIIISPQEENIIKERRVIDTINSLKHLQTPYFGIILPTSKPPKDNVLFEKLNEYYPYVKPYDIEYSIGDVVIFKNSVKGKELPATKQNPHVIVFFSKLNDKRPSKVLDTLENRKGWLEKGLNNIKDIPKEISIFSTNFEGMEEVIDNFVKENGITIYNIVNINEEEIITQEKENEVDEIKGEYSSSENDESFSSEKEESSSEENEELTENSTEDSINENEENESSTGESENLENEKENLENEKEDSINEKENLEKENLGEEKNKNKKENLENKKEKIKNKENILRKLEKLKEKVSNKDKDTLEKLERLKRKIKV